MAQGCAVHGTNGRNDGFSQKLEYSLSFENGVHIYNYIDKPDFDMNTLVKKVYRALGKEENIGFRLPYTLGFSIGKLFDGVAALSGKKFTVSSIRVKKFCSDSMFGTSIAESGFVPPVKLEDGLASTIKYEFVEKNDGELFYTE